MKSPAANGGWVKSYRAKWEHPIFRNKQEAGVWAWMTDCAAFETMTLRTKYGPAELRRGEILISERRVADDFGLTRKVLRRLLNDLQTGGGHGKAPMVELIRDRCPHQLGTIVRIINYNKYQDTSAQRTLDLNHHRDTQGTNKRPMRDQQGTTREEDKESKKDSIVDLAFKKLRAVYPSRRPGSNPWKPALEKFRLKVKAGVQAEDIVRGAEGFAATIAQRREREGDAFNPVTAVCQAVTFINQHRWEQYMAEAEAPLTDEQRAVLARHNGGSSARNHAPAAPEETCEAAHEGDGAGAVPAVGGG